MSAHVCSLRTASIRGSWSRDGAHYSATCCRRTWSISREDYFAELSARAGVAS